MSDDYPVVEVRHGMIYVWIDEDTSNCLTPPETLRLIDRLKQAYEKLRREESPVEEPR